MRKVMWRSGHSALRCEGSKPLLASSHWSALLNICHVKHPALADAYPPVEHVRKRQLSLQEAHMDRYIQALVCKST